MTTNMHNLMQQYRRSASGGAFSGLVKIFSSDSPSPTTSSSSPPNEKVIKLKFSLNNDDCMDLEECSDRQLFQAMFCVLNDIAGKLPLADRVLSSTVVGGANGSGAAVQDQTAISARFDKQDKAIADINDTLKTIKDSSDKQLADIDARLKKGNL